MKKNKKPQGIYLTVNTHDRKDKTIIINAIIDPRLLQLYGVSIIAYLISAQLEDDDNSYCLNVIYPHKAKKYMRTNDTVVHILNFGYDQFENSKNYTNILTDVKATLTKAIPRSHLKMSFQVVMQSAYYTVMTAIPSDTNFYKSLLLNQYQGISTSSYLELKVDKILRTIRNFIRNVEITSNPRGVIYGAFKPLDPLEDLDHDSDKFTTDIVDIGDKPPFGDINLHDVPRGLKEIYIDGKFPGIVKGGIILAKDTKIPKIADLSLINMLANMESGFDSTNEGSTDDDCEQCDRKDACVIYRMKDNTNTTIPDPEDESNIKQ